MKILFQGDSITDASRDRSDCHNMGWGYCLYASQAISARHPGECFEFINMAIGGNRTEDLVARWQTDCIDFKPDVVSVMIGVNDTWHHAEDRSWIPDREFEKNYRNILERTKNETGAKIIMLEQFLLDVPDKAYFREDLDPKLQITRRLAREYADILIPIDGAFAAASVEAVPESWAADGVHPTDAGARLIGRMYADAFDRLYMSLK